MKEEEVEEDPTSVQESHPVPVAQESVRVSRRLEIKRQNKKKKGKLVKIKLKKKSIKKEAEFISSDSESSFLEDVAALNHEEPHAAGKKRGIKRKIFAADPDQIFDGGDYVPPSMTKSAVGHKRGKTSSSDPNIVIQQSYSLNDKTASGATRKRKVFDYESALNEIKEMQERQKTAALMKPDTTSVTTTAATTTTTAASVMALHQQPRISRPNLVSHRGQNAAIQTDQSGNLSSNHYTVLKNNVDLKWANNKLLKENSALKARVDILLEMVVQKTWQLKLLKMTCLEGKEAEPH